MTTSSSIQDSRTVSLLHIPQEWPWESPKKIVAEVNLQESLQATEYQIFILRARIKKEIAVHPPQLQKIVDEYHKEIFDVVLQSANARGYSIKKISSTSRLIQAKTNKMTIGSTSTTNLSIAVDLSDPRLNEITGEVVLHLDGGPIDRLSIPVSCHRLNKIYFSADNIILENGNQTPQSTITTTSLPSRVIISQSPNNIDAQLSISQDKKQHTITIQQLSGSTDQSFDNVRVSIQTNSDNSTPATVDIPVFYHRSE